MLSTWSIDFDFLSSKKNFYQGRPLTCVPTVNSTCVLAGPVAIAGDDEENARRHDTAFDIKEPRQDRAYFLTFNL